MTKIQLTKIKFFNNYSTEVALEKEVNQFLKEVVERGGEVVSVRTHGQYSSSILVVYKMKTVRNEYSD
jgi:hypothetical protein